MHFHFLGVVVNIIGYWGELKCFNTWRSFNHPKMVQVCYPSNASRTPFLQSQIGFKLKCSVFQKNIWHPSKLTGQLRVNHDDSSLGSPSHEPYTVLLDGLQNGNLLFIHDRLSLFFSAKWRLGQNSRPSSSFQNKIGSSTKMYIMDIHRLYLIFVFFWG